MAESNSIQGHFARPAYPLSSHKEFNNAAVMNHDQIPPIDATTHPGCTQCEIVKLQIYGDACKECVEATLLKHLPLLKRTLEERYGAALDQWLATGRFKEAEWIFGTNLTLCKERLNNFLRELVWEAVSKREIELRLLLGQFWSPTDAHPFLNSVQKHCQEDILNLLGSLFNAITETPTEETERELIEVVSGKRRVNKWHLREEAITAVVIAKSTPLPTSTRALIELRYRADGGRYSYTRVKNGEIPSVWTEIKASLPECIVKLLVEEDS